MANIIQVIAAQARVVDRSGTVTLGGTAQVQIPVNRQRVGFWIQNLSAGDLFISEIGAAVAAQPSIKLIPNALYENPITGCTTNAISILGATTAQAFSAREW